MFLTRGGERWPVPERSDTSLRVPAAQATRSRCTVLCIAGGIWRNACCTEPTAARRSCLTSGGQGPKGPEKGESTGGRAEQAYKHRVRDVATKTNLRLLTIRIAFVP